MHGEDTDIRVFASRLIGTLVLTISIWDSLGLGFPIYFGIRKYRGCLWRRELPATIKTSRQQVPGMKAFRIHPTLWQPCQRSSDISFISSSSAYSSGTLCTVTLHHNEAFLVSREFSFASLSALCLQTVVAGLTSTSPKPLRFICWHFPSSLNHPAAQVEFNRFWVRNTT